VAIHFARFALVPPSGAPKSTYLCTDFQISRFRTNLISIYRVNTWFQGGFVDLSTYSSSYSSKDRQSYIYSTYSYNY
jgi:hypothetical protein